MQYHSHTVLKVLFASMFLAMSAAATAQIESIATEHLEQTSGETFWQSEVKCLPHPETIVIQQIGAQSDWCVSLAKDICGQSKEQLAKLTCEASFLADFFSPNIAPKRIVQKPIVQKPIVQKRSVQKNPIEQAPRNRTSTSVSAEATNETINTPSRAGKTTQVLPRILPNRPGRQSSEKPVSVTDAKILEEQIRLQKERVAIDREKFELQEQESKLRARSLEIEEELKNIE